MGGGSTGSSSNSAPLSGEEQAKKFDWLKQELQNTVSGSTSATRNPDYHPKAIGTPGQPGYIPANNEPEYVRTLNTPSYSGYSLSDPGTAKTSAYTNAGAARTLTGGDYDKLQADALKGSTAGLDYLMGKERLRTDAELNKRGIFNSGAAVRAQGDVTDQFLPQYTQAGADATKLRYGMQSNELAGLNQFALSKAADANTFNTNRDAQGNQFNLSRAELLNNANSTEAQRKFDAKWRPYDYMMGGWNGSGGTVSSGGSSGWNFSI